MTILTNLLNEIGQKRKELILKLDDYHVISDQIIHEAMLFLIDHAPPTLHLVLSTRTDPDLPLSRLRVREQTVEIRSSDLCFTQEEATHFLLQRMGLPLSREDVLTLHHRTEGWITGLHLAALSLRKQQDLSSWVSDFAGSYRYLLDYVQQDILAGLPVPLQQFLLQTSILTRMNASICRAVTAAPGELISQKMLEEVERANLFVVPLDDKRCWYRYHDLFGEALRARLHASHPELVPLLHQRAAHWYEAQGEWREAIAHALAAPDYPLAASMMEQAAPHLWLSGECTTVLTWVLSLPDAVLRAHLPLALDAALHVRLLNPIGTQLVPARSQAQLERARTRLEELLRSKSELALTEAEVALVGRRLHLLRALIEATAILKLGDQERLRLLALEIEALPQDAEGRWNVIPLWLTFWQVVSFQYEGASLIPRLLRAKQVMMETGDCLVTIHVMAGLAFVYTQAAQWHLARQECLEALALIEQRGVHTSIAGYLYHFLFQVSYACNQLEEAAAWLQRLRRTAQDWQLMDLLIRGELLSVRLALATGARSPAERSLHQLEAQLEQAGVAIHASWLITRRVQWWLVCRARRPCAEHRRAPNPRSRRCNRGLRHDPLGLPRWHLVSLLIGSKV